MIKAFKVIIAGGVSLLAMTLHAQADFIFTPIAFALFAGPLGAVASFGAIYTGLQLAAYAAVLGAQLLFGGQEQPKINPGEMKNTFQESESSEINAIGRVRLGGLKAFGNTKSGSISRLIWHSKGPAVAFEQYHVGGREVIVEDDGDVSSPPWARSGGSWMNIKTKIGDGTETAWPDLMADFPTLWTPAHRCRGIFQSLVRFNVPSLDTPEGNEKFQKLYQGGAPDIMITGRVNTSYDPRDPAQDPSDVSTWLWSDNGPICAARILMAYPDMTHEDFDWDFIAEEADRADALVATLTGTEKRSRCWGVWPSENPRGQVMQEVLDSIGCEIVLNDEGLVRIRLVDDAPVSEIAFTEIHTPELNWKSGPEAVSRPNICRIKYYSPERGYDMGEIDMTSISWARIDDEVTRYGEKIFDVELPFCPSCSQAQRLARAMFLKARADAGTVRTNFVGLCAWGVTYATITDSDAEEEMLTRMAPPRVDDAAGQVDIPYIVWPQELIDNPWNPATMEAEPPLEAPELQYESELDTPIAPSEASIVQYPDLSYEVRLRFTGVDGGDTAEAVFRDYTGTEPNMFQSMTEYELGSFWYAYHTIDLVGEKVDFKVRFFTDDDEGSHFSPLLTSDPMEIDNTPVPEPTIDADISGSSGNYQVNVDATLQGMNAVSFKLQRLVFFTWFDVVSTNGRPGTVLSHNESIANGNSATFRAIAVTSNGTETISDQVTATAPA
jgi:hypothetical protein